MSQDRACPVSVYVCCLSNSLLTEDHLRGVGRLLLGHPRVISLQAEQMQFPKPLFTSQDLLPVVVLVTLP